MKTVTTLVCHYNYEDFLEKALISSVNQTYKKNRTCLVDDKSEDQDRVLDIAKSVFGNPVYSMKSHDHEIFHYANDNQCILLDKNGGPSYARNYGIATNINSSDYFMILDADDEMIPNKIEALMKPFDKYGNNIGVTYGDYFIKNEKGYTRKEYKEPYNMERLFQECIVHSGSLISSLALRSVQTKYGFYDSRFRVCEDYQLWLRISNRFMFFHVPELLTIVNDHSNNSSNTVSKEEWQQHWAKIRGSLNEQTIQ